MSSHDSPIPKSQRLELDGAPDVQEMHRDLARKHQNVSNKVNAIWRSFTPKRRGEAMKESTGDGIVLKHSRDDRLGSLCDYIPEYNLRDMTSKPEHFLNIFQFRALTPLYDQLYEGASGMPGDRELMEISGMRHSQASAQEKTFFVPGEHYGRDFKPGPAAGGGFQDLPFHGAEFFFVPSPIEEILELGSKTQIKQAPEKTANEALVTAVSNLNVNPKPLKASLPEVRAQAMESKAAAEDYLLLLRSEPTVLNQAVRAAYWSRAELVPDDRGCIIPAITDRHQSAAFFDSIATAVKTIATWDYILRLLQLLDDVSDKVKRGLILQELTNTCHIEYRRTQESFRRNIAPKTHVYGKSFRRLTDKTSGQSRIVMKGQPADCTVSNPQLHFILRLCHPDTSPVAAVQWMQKLDDHNDRHVDDQKKLSEVEMAALGDLAIIISFMHITSTAIPMVLMSRKSGLLFTARSTGLTAELNGLKPKADFGDYLIPMDNFLEPQMATGALATLDDFILSATGARLGSLFGDIVHDSLEDLEKVSSETRARLEKADKTTYVSLPMEPSSDGDARLARRRAKEKTRPAVSSMYTIIPTPGTSEIAVAAPDQHFTVKATIASLFATSFSKSEARGSISWVDFASAMADLGFSVTPKGGPMFTFNAPASMNTRPVTLHRPRVSEVEGYKLLFIRRRLQRVYGWTPASFVVA